MYDKIVGFISDEFGIAKLLTVALAIAVLYLMTVAIPMIGRRLSGETIADYKGFFTKNSYFLPITLVLNIVAFASSFLVKDKLSISDEYGYRISGLFASFDGNPLQLVQEFLEILEDIPALKSIFSGAQYLTLLAGMGAIVLLVFIIKNMQTSFKKINNFYVTICAVVVFLIVLGFVDKFIFSTMLESFEGLSEVFE